jgi:hypothetical protein
MVLLRAKECTVYIGNAISSPSSSATFMSQLTSITDFSARVKSIEISGSEADLETVYLFGTDANGRQNSELEEQNMSDREFSGTLIYTDIDAGELAAGDRVAVGATGYNRIQGDGNREQKCIVLKFVDADTGDVLYSIMNNARFTKLGDISLDAEGHAEQEIGAKCTAKDYFEEYKAA